MTNEEIKRSKNRYHQQRYQAARRGIEFKLTYSEWITWWLATGKYHLRGRDKGKYVMARKGDQGAYELGNIECITHSENVSLKQRQSKPQRGPKISGSKNPKARKVKINGIVYDCIKDAVTIEKKPYSTLTWFLQTKKPGYEYL